MTPRRGGARAMMLVAAIAMAMVGAEPWAPAAALAAQVVERPVPFDLDGRLVVLTPSLVARLGLAAPEWPVAAGFDEARLYAVGEADFVIVVRRGELIERYPLTREQRDGLARRLAAAAGATGMPTQEAGTAAQEESARGQFVRTQTLLGLTVYGGAAALATERGEAYALTAAAAFFASQAIGRSMTVTVPMATMASDLAPRAAIATLLLTPDGASSSGVGAAILATSLAGATIGFNVGRGLTAAEAEATGWGSSSLALAATGLAYGFGGGSWAVRGTAVAAGALGLRLGLEYPRWAPYVLTAGDLYAMRVPQAIGAGAGLSLAASLDTSVRTRVLGATLGYVVGVVAGDRLVAKPYDFTVWQAGLLGTGATVSLFAVAALLPSSSEFGAGQMALLTGAAGLGAWATGALLDLKPGRVVGSRLGASTPARPVGRLRVDPLGAIAAVGRTPGRHVIASYSF